MADDLTRHGGSYERASILEFIERTYGTRIAGLDQALAVLGEREMPRIQISPNDGRILRLLLEAVGARRAVEVGTLSGYSALWILEALGPEGHLWTCEVEQDHARAARAVFDAAGVSDRVTLLVGDGRDSLGSLAASGPFDAVFIDADKEGYDLYARWALEHVREGGLIIADNAYLFGELVAGEADEPPHRGAQRAAVQELHRLLAERCTAACIPTPDGLAVGLVVGGSPG